MSNEDGNKSCRNCFRALDRQRHKAWNEQWHDEDAEWIHGTPNDQYDGDYQQMTSKAEKQKKINEVSKEQLLAINDRLNQIRK